ncbi:carbon-nitrogen hydrolase family protein [Paenibacillus hemerocallicola]|uniref:Carbon-nitrogen hydrolase family protein n=1 Tax=Paenibacillus hemerocallicola TaxID=1172614 RepID=A0A5C4T407_9BACL|nr:carbon-nitrogen hydrolase family protein [Paenibacillus hemerocallicola]TNJ63812.1 carbon-nitrogen hydrolase family protein [Paenibacillus hemerocallicola]
MITIGLASIRHQESISKGLQKIEEMLLKCQEQNVDIVCFPEAYLPGLRGTDVQLPPPDQRELEQALLSLQSFCKLYATMAIVGMEWITELGLHNRAYVISGTGEVLGYQTKNQLPPGGESEHYVPDGSRMMFSVKGVPFGIAICHEAWRYPETVRWAATRGAQIVFQPQWTGRHTGRVPLTEWGTSFFEKAMICRAGENNVYFASVNVTMDYQTSATSLIDPQGRLMQYIPYGKEELLVSEIDPAKATRLFATRFDPSQLPG